MLQAMPSSPPASIRFLAVMSKMCSESCYQRVLPERSSESSSKVERASKTSVASNAAERSALNAQLRRATSTAQLPPERRQGAAGWGAPAARMPSGVPHAAGWAPHASAPAIGPRPLDAPKHAAGRLLLPARRAGCRSRRPSVDHIHDDAARLERCPLPALVVHGGEEDLPRVPGEEGVGRWAGRPPSTAHWLGRVGRRMRHGQGAEWPLHVCRHPPATARRSTWRPSASARPPPAPPPTRGTSPHPAARQAGALAGA